MTHPIGVNRYIDPDTGQVTGTTPLHVRQWLWSLYAATEPAIVAGLEVVGTASMFYRINNGVAVFPYGEGQCVVVPVQQMQVASPEAPAVGTRSDVIHMNQAGVVQVSTSLPAGSVLLDRRVVRAGVTATSATTSELGNRTYAPLRGASMGQLALWKDPTADGARVPDARRQVTAQTFTLDTDRQIECNLQVSYDMARSANVSGIVSTASFVWQTYVDDVFVRTVELGVQDFGETKQDRAVFSLSAGTHTIALYRERRLIGTPNPTTDYPLHRSGGSSLWPGTSYEIRDIGAAR